MGVIYMKFQKQLFFTVGFFLLSQSIVTMQQSFVLHACRLLAPAVAHQKKLDQALQRLLEAENTFKQADAGLSNTEQNGTGVRAAQRIARDAMFEKDQAMVAYNDIKKSFQTDEQKTLLKQYEQTDSDTMLWYLQLQRKQELQRKQGEQLVVHNQHTSLSHARLNEIKKELIKVLQSSEVQCLNIPHAGRTTPEYTRQDLRKLQASARDLERKGHNINYTQLVNDHFEGKKMLKQAREREKEAECFQKMADQLAQEAREMQDELNAERVDRSQVNKESDFNCFQKEQQEAQRILDMAKIRPLQSKEIVVRKSDNEERTSFQAFSSEIQNAAGLGVVGIGAAYGVFKMFGQQSDEDMIAQAAQKYEMPKEAFVVRACPKTGKQVVARIW